MPVVEVVEVMPASIHRAWDVINDVESYSRLMNHVKSVTVKERGPNYRLAEWQIDLKGCVMRWVEREEIYPDRYRIEYRAVKGDLAEFDGYWQLEPLTNDTCRAVHSVRFEIGIPMLSQILNPVAERAIRENTHNMLVSLGSQAAQKEIVPES
jgi:ribosome-associated toxin RatA of RatAB toxin-antitoxin module